MTIYANLGSEDWLAQKDAERRAQIAAREAGDHYTHCRDCGRFVGKALWVKKDSDSAISRSQRPLCSPCFDEYE